jgi:4-hydroxy-4-methyl-2-oxoglutarate aldolase
MSDDLALFAAVRRELFSAVIGDVMDKMGLRHQFLPPSIQPLGLDMVAVGRAMPVLEADFHDDVVEGSRNPLSAKPFGLMLEALDDLKPREIYVCTGGSPRYACWGELMSTRALQCGAAGAVIHGYSRDTRGILALGFPTFSFGRYAQDQGPRGKVVDFRVPVEIEGVRIEPGDILFADLDGVCVVPRNAEQDVFAAAFEKVRKEQTVRRALESGMTAAGAFEKFGVL